MREMHIWLWRNNNKERLPGGPASFHIPLKRRSSSFHIRLKRRSSSFHIRLKRRSSSFHPDVLFHSNSVPVLGLNLASNTVDYHANHTDSETRSDRHISNRIITNINTRSRAQVSRFGNPDNLLHTSETNPSQTVRPNCVHA